MSVNKAILVGNVGNDPEVRYLDSGTPLARFSLATSENYTNRNGEKVSQTEWHNIVAWRGLAEVAEKFVKKGTQLYIEGRIRTRSWDDKDGNKRYTTEINADVMQMLGRRADSANDFSGPAPQQNMSQQNTTTQTSAGQGMDPSAAGADETDDLPF